MANATFNAHVDFFGLQAATSNALKIKSSNENRSKQSASGANLYGDAAVVDSYGETAAPSAEYDIVGALTQAVLPVLGSLNTPTELAKPVVLGSVTINTRTGEAPSLSASGQMVQTGAAQLRSYTLPAFSVSTRHRAQDFLGLCNIKKGSATADDVEDYGLASVSATFPIEFTLAQPQGEVVNYDLHGGMATCDFEMQWYASTAPTVELTSAATALGATITTPVTKGTPQNGYTTYTWQISFPMTGIEYVAQSNS